MSARILIVEDRDSLRRMLEAALGQEGYEVAVAADGQAAIRLLGERPFDFVLTDLKLPDVSGLEVLEASRAAAAAGAGGGAHRLRHGWRRRSRR